MGYISTISINSNDQYLIEPQLFATAGGTNTALTAGINNFELVAGAYVNIKVGEVGANATLNVNNTGAKDIYYNDVQISAGMLTEGNVYTFVYDGAHWVILGDITGQNIMIGTTAEWQRRTSYIPPKGTILIYSDHGTSNNKVVPGIKVADGLAYGIDQPFVGDDVRDSILETLNNHIRDDVRHITSDERTFWNNKLNYAVTGEILQLNRS